MSELTPESFEHIPWQAPWRYVRIGEGTGYEGELATEACEGHPLHKVRAIAVGVRVDRDDVLFLLPDAPKPLAVVHFTRASAPEGNSRFPYTAFYSSLDDWLRRGMAADHAHYLNGTVPENEDE
jgi:hypothetical protein